MVDDDWVDVEGVAPIEDERLLDDLSLLTEVTHQVRGRLLRRLAKPATVAEMAAMLDVPVTRLYHHVNRLEELGLIVVVATRQAGGVVERRYRAVANGFKIDRNLLEEADKFELSKGIGALFDTAKVELQAEIESGQLRDSILDEQVMLSMADLKLSRQRMDELRQAILDLIEDFMADGEGASEGEGRFRLFVAGYPTDR